MRFFPRSDSPHANARRFSSRCAQSRLNATQTGFRSGTLVTAPAQITVGENNIEFNVAVKRFSGRIYGVRKIVTERLQNRHALACGFSHDRIARMLTHGGSVADAHSHGLTRLRRASDREPW